MYNYMERRQYKKKIKYVDRNFDCHVEINKERGKIYISFDMPEGIQNISADLIDTKTLGHTILSNAIYDSAEGHIVLTKITILNIEKIIFVQVHLEILFRGKINFVYWN